MSKSHYVGAMARRILDTLRQGQKHKRMLCGALQCDYQSIDPTIAELLRRGEVVILGTAKEAGYVHVNAHAPVYGLPGMTLLPAPVKARTNGGSGQIAGAIVIGRGYSWSSRGGPW